MSRAFTRDRRIIAALRVRAHHLDSADFASPAAVVRYMLAMQAQDFPAAKWAIGVRATGTTDAAIETAIANREIVRSWPMRGTLHFVPPEDLGWMLAVGRHRMVRSASTRLAQLGLDELTLRRAHDIAVESLAGDRHLSRNDLQAVWESRGIPTTGQRGYTMLWYLSITGVLVFGPVLGKQHSFVLLDEWVKNPRNLDGDEALGEFARRYLTSHGPATERDLAWWASMTLRDARRGIEVAAADLDEIEVGGVTYYLAHDAIPAKNGVHLLRGFDEYIIGYQDRQAQLSTEMSVHVFPGKNGIFLPTLVIDGEVVGTWRTKVGPREAIIEILPRQPLAQRAVSGISAATRRYGKFLEKPAILMNPE